MLAVCFVNYDASAALVFDGLSDRVKACMRFSDLRNVSPQEAVDGASAVLLVRGMHDPRLRVVAARSAARGVPYYLYFDDNFWVLAAEFAEYRWLATADGEAFVRAAAGMVVTSDALEDYARTQLGCRNVFRFSPILNRELETSVPKAAGAPRALRVAFTGSQERNRPFDLLVAPALISLARSGWDVQVSLRLGAPIAGIGLAGVKCDLLRTYEDFATFIGLWRSHTPQVLVHPPVESANVPYKTPSIILIAHLLGAVPVVANEPAFSGLSEDNGVVVVGDDTREAWVEAIAKVSAPSSRRPMLRRLSAWCAEAFSPDGNEATIMRLAGT